MPNHNFKCRNKKCNEIFEDICSFADLEAGFPNVICPNCKSKRVEKLLSAGNVLWTSSKMQNFEIRAGVNMEKAKNERAAAESAQKMKHPYRNIDDTRRGNRMNFVE